MPNANRDKGLKFERDVAAYFRTHGIATAERSVSTGWATAQRSLADSGDIKGIPGITVQCKYLAKPLVDKALLNALGETAEQCSTAGNVIPLLVEKRHGVADAGYSYAWLSLKTTVLLTTDDQWCFSTAPLRTELRHIIEYLVIFSKGYSNGRSSNSGQR